MVRPSPLLNTHWCPSGARLGPDWAVLWILALPRLPALNGEANQCLLCGNPSWCVCRVKRDRWLARGPSSLSRFTCRRVLFRNKLCKALKKQKCVALNQMAVELAARGREQKNSVRTSPEIFSPLFTVFCKKHSVGPSMCWEKR